MPIDDIEDNETEFKYDPGTVLETRVLPNLRYLVSQVGTTELEDIVQPAYELVDLTPNWQSDDKEINFSHATYVIQRSIVEDPFNFTKVGFFQFLDEWKQNLMRGEFTEEMHQIRPHYNGPGFRYLH